MGMMIGLAVLGFFAGGVSGLIGIGGGVVIVPCLVFIFGMPQNMAQGTTLALLVPPIGLWAAWTYYKQGYVDLKVAAVVCLGFVFGSFLGARFAVGLPNDVLRRVFGAALFLISLKMIAGK